jgi:ABC-type multidrug transport system fused ATPase/permease subunit
LIQKCMENWMENRASFNIAHPLSTTRQAGQILVIEEERITGLGSYAQ